MKSILISIKPEYVANILNGYKTLEIRKTKPNIELPCKVYIYCTKGRPYLYRVNDDNEFELTKKIRFQDSSCFVKDYNAQNGKVVAEFTLKNISYWQPYWTSEVMHICDISEKSCISIEDLMKYCGNKTIYAWHIEDLKIYDNPKELSEFKKRNKCHYANYEDGCCFECCTFYDLGDCDGKYSKIERSPQSWMFIESLEDE